MLRHTCKVDDSMLICIVGQHKCKSDSCGPGCQEEESVRVEAFLVDKGGLQDRMVVKFFIRATRV